MLFVKPSINRAFITTIFPCVPTPMLTSEGDIAQVTVVEANQTTTAINSAKNGFLRFIFFSQLFIALYQRKRTNASVE